MGCLVTDPGPSKFGNPKPLMAPWLSSFRPKKSTHPEVKHGGIQLAAPSLHGYLATDLWTNSLVEAVRVSHTHKKLATVFRGVSPATKF